MNPNYTIHQVRSRKNNFCLKVGKVFNTLFTLKHLELHERPDDQSLVVIFYYYNPSIFFLLSFEEYSKLSSTGELLIVSSCDVEIKNAPASLMQTQIQQLKKYNLQMLISILNHELSES